MSTTWFSSDHHFWHKNVIKFTYPSGKDRTQFEDIVEHNEHLITQHNSVVQPNDKVYLLGDIAWNSKAIECIKRMNGRKILVMGNHDKQKANSYLGCVDDLKGVVCISKGINAVATHVPIHPCQLEHRFNCNIHGHMHGYCIDDPRYINVSMEQINFTPISLDDIITQHEKQMRGFNQ